MSVNDESQVFFLLLYTVLLHKDYSQHLKSARISENRCYVFTSF